MKMKLKKGIDLDPAKNARAVFALLDTVKNAPLYPGQSISESIGKSLKNWPDSAIENHIDGKAVMDKTFPEWGEGSKAAAGLVLDVLDPTLLLPGGAAKLAAKAGVRGATKAQNVVKVLDKVLNPGSLAVSAGMKGGANLVRKGAAKSYIKKAVTKSAVSKGKDVLDEAEKLIEYANKNGYNKDLLDAEKIKNTLQGPLAKDASGELKRTGGVKAVLGKKVEDVLDAAEKAGAPKIDRTEIEKTLRSAVEAINKSDVSGETRNVEKFVREIDESIKPLKKTAINVPTFKPSANTTPLLPTASADQKIAQLKKSLEEAKKTQAVRSKQAVERKAAESAVDKENKAAVAAFEKEKADILKMQEDEALGTLERVGQENSKIVASNEKVAKQIEAAKAANAAKKKKVEVLQPFKVAPDADAETKVAMEIYNRRAKRSMKDAISQADIEPISPKKIKELEGQIRPLATAKPDVAVKSLDDLPPPVPKQVDVPPPIPQTGESVEDIIKQLADAEADRAMLSKGNKDIIAKNAAETAAAKKATIPGGTVEVATPNISSVKDMWELRKNLADRISELNLNKVASDATNETERILREAQDQVEEAIQKSLEAIPSSKYGNMKEMYLAAKKDYKEASKFDKFITSLAEKQAKEGASIPYPSTPNVLRTAAEYTIGPGTRLKAANLVDSAAQSSIAEGAAGFVPRAISETVHGTFDKQQEYSEETSEDGSLPVYRFEDFEPEQTGRGPSSVEESGLPTYSYEDFEPEGENPLAQRMANTLAPTKPAFNPYLNEEILNTLLPRDSKRLLANPAAVKAKVSQFAPQIVPMLDDVMANDPEGIAKAGPMLVKMAPHLFERDEYEMFDGKIVDPEMQAKFMGDLSNDEGLSSIEKAQLAMKVTRGQPLWG